MIELIRQNKFQELKEKIENRENSFQIYKYLGDVLNKIKVEIDGKSFNAQKYQEEFFEGLEIFKALNKSEIPKDDFKEYTNILVQLAFKTGGFIKLMANTALKNGVYLSDISDTYKVHPELRSKFQEFIDLLKEKNDTISIANVAGAKAQITTSIGNLLEKQDIGNDVLQSADSYANIGHTKQAIQMYREILKDFESESVKNSSGLFPEISQVDTRPEAEIEIYEKAKNQYEKLSGEKIPEVKRVQVKTNKQAKKLVQEVHKKERKIITAQESRKIGVLNKLKNLFKIN